MLFRSIGVANPTGNDPQVVIGLDTPVGTLDTALGPQSLPTISTPITIEADNAGLAVLDTNADVRMFLLRPDTAGLDVAPDLTLKRIQVIDARPGPSGATGTGPVVGGGAVHLTGEATTTGALGTFSAQNVDRKSTRLNSSHIQKSRMPSSA